MSDTNNKIKPFCGYCDKILSKEKGELEHGCLDCHGDIRVERIDAMENIIKRLKAQLKEAENIMRNIQDDHELDFTHIREYFDRYN